MSPQAYEYLLVVANLAYFNPKWGFSIKTRMWQPFIDGRRFSASHDRGTFEIDSKNLDLTSFILGVSPKPKHRARSNFIRIGVLAVDSPRKIELKRYSDGRMKTTPPRLNGLHFRWRTFRELMDPFVWKYIINNGLEEVKKVEDDISSDDDESSVLKPPPPSTANTAVKRSATTVDDSSKYPHLS